MADWNQPTNASLYTDVLTNLKDRDLDAAKMFSSAPTNPVDGMIRFNRSTFIFEERGSGTWIAQLLGLTGGGTGASSASGARTNLGLGSIATQSASSVSITGGSIASTTIGSTNNISADAITSGTLPNARFPATLPVASGANLTNLPAANLTGTLPAISGANLTNLNASNLASGTVGTARLGSGTANSTSFLRGDQTWATITAPDGIPTGLIAMFDAACPTGWTRFSALDDKFPMGKSSYGATGGVATHSHGLGTLLTVDNNPIRLQILSSTENAGNDDVSDETIPTTNVEVQAGGGFFINIPDGSAHHHQQANHAHALNLYTEFGGLHNHGMTGALDDGTTIPPWLGVVWCKKN